MKSLKLKKTDRDEILNRTKDQIRRIQYEVSMSENHTEFAYMNIVCQE
jgi:hypothetical protein